MGSDSIGTNSGEDTCLCVSYCVIPCPRHSSHHTHTPTRTQAAIQHSDNVISGQTECGSQYHFHMETQTALVIPLEDCYTVYSATQWTDSVQAAVADVLGVSTSSVDVSVKRIGGAYGSKITRANLIAAACAVGAYATKRYRVGRNFCPRQKWDTKNRELLNSLWRRFVITIMTNV